MKTIAALLCLVVSLSAFAQDDDGLADLDKEVLVELVRRQQALIEQLEARIAALEAGEVEEVEGAEGDDPELEIEEFASIGAMLQSFPQELIPGEDNTWETYLNDANQWLDENIAGSGLRTAPRRGHGWVVDGVYEVEGEDNQWNCILVAAYEESRGTFIAGTGMIPGGNQIVFASLGRRNKVRFNRVVFQIVGVESYRIVEPLMADGVVVTVNGTVQEIALNERAELNVWLEPNATLEHARRLDVLPNTRSHPTLP